MNLNDKLYVIERMAQLIELKKTGNALTFSEKLGISRSQLFIEIDELKSLNVDVSYDRRINSFVYSGTKKIRVRTPILVVRRSELTTINGGFVHKIPFIHFSEW